MQQYNRVSNNHQEDLDRTKIINFIWNGKLYQGYAGDTLASALLAYGVNLFGRSFKYGRYRGVVTAGVDEPNALVELESDGFYVPNIKATEVQLYEGLVAKAASGRPNLNLDSRYLLKLLHKFMNSGFYYKTFKWPRSFWPKYEKLLRKFAGFANSPVQKDSEVYDHLNLYQDVVIVGGGVTGIKAALSFIDANYRVVLIDDQQDLGGAWWLASDDKIKDLSVKNWIKKSKDILRNCSNITVLTRTTAFALHDNNLIKAWQSLQDHLPLKERNNSKPRQRLYTIYAKQVILATGMQERMLAFHNNDLPNIMTSSAIARYYLQFSVQLARKLVLVTNNDSIYEVLDIYNQEIDNSNLKLTIVDVRNQLSEELKKKVELNNVELYLGYAPVEAIGKKQVKSLVIQQVCQVQGELNTWQFYGDKKTLACDAIGVSGGWNPVIHLGCHTGSKPRWSKSNKTFILENNKENLVCAGGLDFCVSIDDCLNSAQLAVDTVVSRLGYTKSTINLDIANYQKQKSINIAPFYRSPSEHDKQFIDFQNDVTAKDIALAITENFTSIEHVKRYTALGFGTDQGKLGNILGIAVCSELLNKPIPDIGVTTFRPAYTPVSFGCLAGEKVRDNFDLERYTPMHKWHLEHNAEFEDVGQWKRAWYYSLDSENIEQAVNRECLAARQSVAMVDASTLGKIDIQGPDAREFLNRLLPNSWSKIKSNTCRYYILMNDDGMVFDDGVIACVDQNHFHMMTTTGNAAASFNKLEKLLQVDWPELQVYLTSITDHLGVTAVVGQNSRKVLQKVCSDIDFSNENFPFMCVRHGTILDIPVTVMRISFSGELAYEVNVQSNYSLAVWDAIYQAGQEFDITPYGTETLHVLRAEKGYPIIGQDTDGSVTGKDLGMSWMFSKKKAYSYLGKRAHELDYLKKEERKQYVGLVPVDKTTVLPEGAQVLFTVGDRKSKGHVTSSYYSSVLGYPIALALVENGFSKSKNKNSNKVYIKSHNCNNVAAEITSTVFYDKEGVMQHV